ncbi:hypothetical protein V6N13_118599 [Hibiscus sabdariffa]|uniref:Uncharacterized protein n=1 Tax=Hibiscus sabdariffa TaxID=183260 RepID=A0ABR2BSD7_9ROSI
MEKDGSLLGTGVPQDAPSAPSGFDDVALLRAVLVPVAPSPITNVHLVVHATASVAILLEDTDDVEVHDEAIDGDHGLSDVFAVDGSGRVHVSENALLADDEDVEVLVPKEPPIKIPAKRSSGGSDPSRVKRANSIVSTPILKDTHATKAGMRSSKNSLEAVDKQSRQGK